MQMECLLYAVLLPVNVRQMNLTGIVSSSTYQVSVEILQPKGNIYVWWQLLVLYKMCA